MLVRNGVNQAKALREAGNTTRRPEAQAAGIYHLDPAGNEDRQTAPRFVQRQIRYGSSNRRHRSERGCIACRAQDWKRKVETNLNTACCKWIIRDDPGKELAYWEFPLFWLAVNQRQPVCRGVVLLSKNRCFLNFGSLRMRCMLDCAHDC